MTTKLSNSEARSLGIKTAKRGNKYNARKVTIDGITFASAKEAKRYCELRELQKAGVISHLETQPVFKFELNGRQVLIRSDRYPNGRQAKYSADFSYFDGKNRVVEDVKSKATRTEAYALRKALVEAMFPAVRIVEI